MSTTVHILTNSVYKCAFASSRSTYLAAKALSFMPLLFLLYCPYPTPQRWQEEVATSLNCMERLLATRSGFSSLPMCGIHNPSQSLSYVVLSGASWPAM